MATNCCCGSGTKYRCPVHPNIPPFEFKQFQSAKKPSNRRQVSRTLMKSEPQGGETVFNTNTLPTTGIHYSSMNTDSSATVQYTYQLPSSTSQSVSKRLPPPNTTLPEPKRARNQVNTILASTSSPATPLRQVEMARIAAASVPQSYHIGEEAEGAKRVQAARALDVWLFFVGAQTRQRPSEEELAQARLVDQARAECRSSLDLRKPSAPLVRCTECLKQDEWRTWKNNSNGGSPHHLRPHLLKEHRTAYFAGCDMIGYTPDNKADTPEQNSDDIHQPITADGILRYITEWFAEDDISFNTVSHRGFRRFFSYIGQGKVTTKDIPDRHSVALKAQKLSAEAKLKIKKEIKHARGRISCTSDLWTDESQRPFMTVTAHFVNKHRRMVHRVIGFRVIEGDHSGAHLAENFFAIVEEFGFTNKLGMITLDNASNNDTLMAQLEAYMADRGLDFDREGNRLRCFPHVINLAVKAILAALSESAQVYRYYVTKAGEAIPVELETYLLALESEPHNRIRKTAVALRRTQRRQGVRNTIHEGNEQRIWRTHKLVDGDWKLEDFQMKSLELILDCPTRWSSTRNMIERFLYLYPAISRYIASDVTLAEYSIAHMDYEVLSDILDVLDLAHRTQELLSSDKTPTLSLALPLYHALIDQWRSLQTKRPALSHAIGEGIDKLETYLAKTRSSPAHIVAMALNPSIRYEWIDQNWSQVEASNAREVVKQHMRRSLEEQQREHSESLTHHQPSTTADTAATRLNKGYASFLTSDVNARPTSALFSPDYSSRLSSPEAPSSHSKSVADVFDSAVAAPKKPLATSATASTDALNTATVELEHQRFTEEPVIPAKDMEGVSAIDYWLSKSSQLPLIFKVALDILPAQASSVSSERVFSSSKMTCTQSRNRISASRVESLQILKHALRSNPDALLDDEQNTLDFMTQHDDELSGHNVIRTIE